MRLRNLCEVHAAGVANRDRDELSAGCRSGFATKQFPLSPSVVRLAFPITRIQEGTRRNWRSRVCRSPAATRTAGDFVLTGGPFADPVLPSLKPGRLLRQVISSTSYLSEPRALEPWKGGLKYDTERSNKWSKSDRVHCGETRDVVFLSLGESICRSAGLRHAQSDRQCPFYPQDISTKDDVADDTQTTAFCPTAGLPCPFWPCLETHCVRGHSPMSWRGRVPACFWTICEAAAG